MATETFEFNGQTYPVTEDVVFFTVNMVEEHRDDVDTVEVLDEDRLRLHYTDGREEVKWTHEIVQASVESNVNRETEVVETMIDELNLQSV